MDIQPGTVLDGQFVILSELGRGASGIVYRAEDRILRRFVAVKVLRPECDASMRLRFLHEAQILAQIRHPHIVPVHHAAVEAESGRAYFVMDLLPESLDGRISEARTLPESDVAALALQLLSALEALHSHQPPIVHRDVKPSNLLLDETGALQLADFGIAHEAVPDNRGLTKTGIQPGTSAYAAPEQKAGFPISPAADYYAFGCALYRLLTGGMPEPEETDLPEDIAPHVSRHWRRLLRGLLRFDPKSRLVDSGQIRKTLQRIAHRPSMRKAWLWGAAAALLALAAIAAAWSFRPSPVEEETTLPVVEESVRNPLATARNENETAAAPARSAPPPAVATGDKPPKPSETEPTRYSGNVPVRTIHRNSSIPLVPIETTIGGRKVRPVEIVDPETSAP